MANFVLVQDGVVTERHDLLPESWNGNALRTMSVEDRKALGWYNSVVEEPLGWDGNTHRMTGPFFTVREDDVLEKYVLEERSAEEIAEIQAIIQAQAEQQPE